MSLIIHYLDCWNRVKPMIAMYNFIILWFIECLELCHLILEGLWYPIWYILEGLMHSCSDFMLDSPWQWWNITANFFVLALASSAWFFVRLFPKIMVSSLFSTMIISPSSFCTLPPMTAIGKTWADGVFHPLSMLMSTIFVFLCLSWVLEVIRDTFCNLSSMSPVLSVQLERAFFKTPVLSMLVIPLHTFSLAWFLSLEFCCVLCLLVYLASSDLLASCWMRQRSLGSWTRSMMRTKMRFWCRIS